MFGKKKHNFLSAAAVRHPRKHDPYVKGAKIAFVSLGIVAVAVTVLVLPFWFVSERVYSLADQGREDLMAAQTAVEVLDFETAFRRVEDAQDEFTSAQSELKKLEPLGGLPFIGPHLVAADHLLSTGIATSSAVHDVLGIGRDIVAIARETEGLSGALSGVMPGPSTLFKDLTPAQKRQILATLSTSVPKIRVALLKTDEALRSFDDIPTEGVAEQFTATLKPFRAKLVTMRDGLEAALPVLEIAPGILGYPSEKHYLFFFQNNTELRPTGGFLGVFGSVFVKDAELASVTTRDVYALDGPNESQPRPVPPEPIRKYIGIDKWYLRDANWSPDFTVSAGVMKQFFREEALVALGPEAATDVDGVVAVTPDFAVDVLRIVGNVTIDDVTFTPENLVDQLEFEVEKGFVESGIAFHQRKDIVGKLMEEIIRRMSSLPLSRIFETLAVVERNLAEGNILLNASSSDLQSLVLSHDWGGRVKATQGDYLMVIDANLASLKTDAVIRRSAAYAIIPSGTGYEGRVTLTYENRGTFTWKTTRYRTYTRVYVPAGSELVGWSGMMENDKLKDPARRPGKPDVVDELGKRVFGAFISIEPGEKRSMEFRYKLAPSVVKAIQAGTYRLDVEKQPGTPANGLTLDLDFGKNLSSAVPAEDRKEWGDKRYRIGTDLRIDRLFEIGL